MNVNEYAEKAGELFVLPDSVTQLKKHMDDEASSMDDIGDVISTDPALSMQLLRAANSALYRFPKKIDTITRALQVIGTRAAYDLSLAYGVTHAFKDVDGGIIDLDQYWEQAISCGLLAKYIAEFHGHREPERFFVSGLLHSIGELVIVSIAPDKAKQCQRFSEKVTPYQLQVGILGFSFTDLSAELIKSWELPKSIYQPIGQIHNPETATERDAHVLQLAYNLALDNIHSDVYPAYTNITEQMHTRLDMDRDDLEAALDETNLQCIGLMNLFSPTSFLLY